MVSSRSFPRHAHDQFGIGLMVSGGHRSWSGRGEVEPVAGDVIAANPGEMHDGIAVGGERGWRMLYLDPELVRSLTGDDVGSLEIVRPAFRDARLAALVARAFVQATHFDRDPLAFEEALVGALIGATAARRPTGGERAGSSGARIARQRLDDAPEDPVTLAQLAALAGTSRFGLLRAFAREFHVTPHRYLVQRRVGLAQSLLAGDERPAAAAAAAGFADQSHMARAFVRQLGVTPARYRSAVS